MDRPLHLLLQRRAHQRQQPVHQRVHVVLSVVVLEQPHLAGLLEFASHLRDALLAPAPTELGEVDQSRLVLRGERHRRALLLTLVAGSAKNSSRRAAWRAAA